jgi:predicted alpha/beta hydrolase
MKTQELALPDGARTVIEWFDPSAQPARAVVLLVPAMGVNVAYYRGLGAAWAQRGYRVAAVEMRGMKQSSVRDVRRQNFGYKEVLNIDLAAQISSVAQEAGEQPLYLAGHSLGGQFALLAASRATEKIAGVIVLAGGSNHYAAMPSWYSRRKRHAGLCWVRLVNQLLGFFPGDKLGFGGRQPSSIIRDWSHEALTGRYRVDGDPTDYDAALNRLTRPVLLLSLSGDPLVPRTCADALARKLKQAHVTQVELQAHEHGLKAFSHFSWVKKPAPILDQIELWERKIG